VQITLHLTDWASPDATADLPGDPAAAARGRNGWFVPQQILVWRGEQVQLAVRSRRMGASAPVQLHLSRPAAQALGRALLAAAADLAAIVEAGKGQGTIKEEVDSLQIAWMMAGWAWTESISHLIGAAEFWDADRSAKMLDTILRSITKVTRE